MGAGRIVFQGWAMRGSEGQKSSSRVQGQLSGGDLGVKPPEVDDIFSKWCINTSSTEVSDNICSKKTFQHFQGASAPPCPCLQAPMNSSCSYLVIVVLLTLLSSTKIMNSRSTDKPWNKWINCIECRKYQVRVEVNIGNVNSAFPFLPREWEWTRCYNSGTGTGIGTREWKRMGMKIWFPHTSSRKSLWSKAIS